MFVEITMEKTIRLTKTYEVTKDEYEAIESDGINPRQKEMEKAIIECEKDYSLTGNCEADVEFDYTITDEDGKEMVQWR